MKPEALDKWIKENKELCSYCGIVKVLSKGDVCKKCEEALVRKKQYKNTT